jgi:hypothetical protein
MDSSPGIPSAEDWEEAAAIARASARKPSTPAASAKAEIAVPAKRRREKCLNVIRVPP